MPSKCNIELKSTCLSQNISLAMWVHVVIYLFIETTWACLQLYATGVFNA